jgi:hypothetical protein
MPKPPPIQDASELARPRLFTVRVWQEDLGEGRVEWRGKVQHVASGEAHYFRDWATLVAMMQKMLETSEISGTTRV